MYGVDSESLPFRVEGTNLMGIMECNGAFRHAEDAAMAVANGAGRFVRYGSLTVWTEGQEEIEAAESYDEAAATMYERIDRAMGVSSNPAELWATAGCAER